MNYSIEKKELKKNNINYYKENLNRKKWRFQYVRKKIRIRILIKMVNELNSIQLIKSIINNGIWDY